ncbi:MAG TPA: pyruvate dehydrogenase complex dihydrolipoamide acetyltransferase [Chitinophagaceae bacterium]|jgi:pyruvate dehydrogenase E2 component (dihydrolipoamide acetyltransferase)|nr:pyruvate dehydrogenase complex dihydrolipoamide acetyltransferase [Chitinophagaceae bacterium]
MAEAILMPRLSDTMTEGVIAEWHKKVGDKVKKGDLLAEIETDKATMELESYKDGTLLHIGTDKGGKLQVNDLLAIIGQPGEDISTLLKGQGSGNKPTSAGGDAAQEQKTKAASDKKQEVKQATATNQQTATSTQQPATSSQQSIDPSKMEEVVLMPRLSDTMTEGVIASWQKNVGDTVKKGDVLAEIETDKATMELESYKNGTLLYIGAQQGEKIAVNELLCIIGEKGKVNVDAIVNAAKTQGTSDKEQGAGNKEQDTSNKPQENIKQETTSQQAATNGRIKASPLAKKLAAEKGIDLHKVHGTGDGGRITKEDIDNYKEVAIESRESTAKQPETAKYIPSAPVGKESFEEFPVSQMRKTIAKRLVESKFTAPHFYLTMSIDMDKAVESRTKLNETSPVKISFNDIVLKACAVALKKHPAVNSSWLDDKIRRNYHIHIGVAVAVEEGLLVPVVRFADTKSLSQIAVEVKEFAQKAKDKKLQPKDWEGNTFTISNLGMFGIDEFTAIINPPDSCILAIGGIQQVPVVKEGQIKIGNVMKVTMSCDHRVVDGATGAAFLQTLKGLLEEPLRMLV